MTANAAIVHVDDQELSIDISDDLGYRVDWDVDGQHGSDFYLSINKNFYTFAGGGVWQNWLYLNSNNPNGRGFINDLSTAEKDINNLSTGFRVGPTLDANYYFGVSGDRQRILVSGTDGGFGRLGSADGFTSGAPGFAGFRFVDENDTMLYGWARITITANHSSITIHEWAYENTGAEIRVGDVPEPHSLALLAMGSAGLATWRSRRN